MSWQFFHKIDPLKILILCKKQLKNFPLWANWQTPQYVQNGPQCGAQNIKDCIFFNKLTVQCLIDKFSNLSILGWLAEPLLFTIARNVRPQILWWNFITGHKYCRGTWNLPHKFHLYLIIFYQMIRPCFMRRNVKHHILTIALLFKNLYNFFPKTLRPVTHYKTFFRVFMFSHHFRVLTLVAKWCENTKMQKPNFFFTTKKSNEKIMW